ncbi:MAG: hypothetical protein OXC15_12485 [Rhodospirillaceae bacterium]|nr:hypothetical protein [Rhodospirillaceae bacterium]
MQRRHRKTHAYMWKVLAIFLPAMLIAALAIRQHGPTEKSAVQLEKPGAQAEAPAATAEE